VTVPQDFFQESSFPGPLLTHFVPFQFIFKNFQIFASQGALASLNKN
jgi:hypothetical protein